jgi:hypothetical protein
MDISCSFCCQSGCMLNPYGYPILAHHERGLHNSAGTGGTRVAQQAPSIRCTGTAGT